MQNQLRQIDKKRSRWKRYVIFQLIVAVVFFVPYAWDDFRNGGSLVLTVIFYLLETLIGLLWYADSIFVYPDDKGGNH